MPGARHVRPPHTPRVLGTSRIRVFGAHIVGRHIELVADQRVVQAWRVVDWDPGVYSIAKFELKDRGTGAALVFDHTGFPNGQGAHLAEGWEVNYWAPLRKLLG